LKHSVLRVYAVKSLNLKESVKILQKMSHIYAGKKYRKLSELFKPNLKLE